MKKSLEGITEVELFTDEKGIYLAYCTLKEHQGLLSPGRAEICEEKKCENYKRLYL